VKPELGAFELIASAPMTFGTGGSTDVRLLGQLVRWHLELHNAKLAIPPQHLLVRLLRALGGISERRLWAKLPPRLAFFFFLAKAFPVHLLLL
jgi:hypothetical protein